MKNCFKDCSQSILIFAFFNTFINLLIYLFAFFSVQKKDTGRLGEPMSPNESRYSTDRPCAQTVTVVCSVLCTPFTTISDTAISDGSFTLYDIEHLLLLKCILMFCNVLTIPFRSG